MVTENYNISIPAGASLTFTGFGISSRNRIDQTTQTFIVAPADSAGGEPGAMVFTGTSQASRAIIINNGATSLGAAGGSTTFQDLSLGFGATVIANGGTNGGKGGLIQFLDHADAVTAEIEVYGNGTRLGRHDFTDQDRGVRRRWPGHSEYERAYPRVGIPI